MYSAGKSEKYRHCSISALNLTSKTSKVWENKAAVIRSPVGKQVGEREQQTGSRDFHRLLDALS